MLMEIHSASNFLVQLLRIRPNNGLSDFQMSMLKWSISQVLIRRYEEHWFPDKPTKGSGYRCIRINKTLDPVLAQAGRNIGLGKRFLTRMFPSELTMWIDPAEVSYRIGEDGSICVLYEEGKSPPPVIQPEPSPPSPSEDDSGDNTSGGCKEAMLILDPHNTSGGCKEAMLILDPHNTSFSYTEASYVSG